MLVHIFLHTHRAAFAPVPTSRAPPSRRIPAAPFLSLSLLVVVLVASTASVVLLAAPLLGLLASLTSGLSLYTAIFVLLTGQAQPRDLI